MLRLCRKVRFAVNSSDVAGARATNSFAGYPSLKGVGHFLSLDVTLLGEVNSDSGYMRNIKDIDQVVRDRAVPLAAEMVRSGKFDGGATMLLRFFDALKDAWPGCTLDRLRLWLSPFLGVELFAREYPMIRLSQKFEFCASHRLHNPAMSDADNRKLFGKCNNPHGHGHNYIVQVTTAGEADKDGQVMPVAVLEQIVASNVIEPLDHKNLNVEVAEFGKLNPSVENIAKVIFRRLKPKFEAEKVKLAGVTVWETEKTWCEYSE